MLYQQFLQYNERVESKNKNWILQVAAGTNKYVMKLNSIFFSKFYKIFMG